MFFHWRCLSNRTAFLYSMQARWPVVRSPLSKICESAPERARKKRLRLRSGELVISGGSGVSRPTCCTVIQRHFARITVVQHCILPLYKLRTITCPILS